MLMEMTSCFKCTEEGKKDMSEAFRKMYESDIEEAMKEGIKEGIRKGSDERAEDSARRMIQDGSIPLAKIAKFSGLSLDEVEKLKRSMDI